MSNLAEKVGLAKGSIVKYAFIGILLLIVASVLSKSFFYAEPGYIYHVRTVLGSEEVVTDVGYKFYPFGRYNSWKRAMTVQARGGSTQNSRIYNKNDIGISAESDSNGTSANLGPMSIMFLDQVDAHAEATVRFSIPSDEESFLRLAHESSSPANLSRHDVTSVRWGQDVVGRVDAGGRRGLKQTHITMIRQECACPYMTLTT